MNTEHHPDDQDLDRRLAGLTTEHAPDPALWNAIEARLRPRRRPWAVPGAIAAAAGALALLLATLTPVLTRQPLPDPGIAAIQAEARALQALEPDPLPATWVEAPAGLEAAWQENQAAIAELEQALERTPGNRTLLEFLAQARLRQARLLGQAATEDFIPTPTERRIDT
ncbi:MAG: hypothetical protein CVV18_00460 [Gammaproteobacteria bacterium HGW-Gammaproteobacteria-8]|nr:MAG: hypothetical protein CVV18_00460 [Gammaproteobacteria bacterium HGW-Gammaproteobacteria-8]